MSGGLDSGLLLARLLRRGVAVAPLYVRCGLRWERVELWWLRRFLRALRSRRLLALRVIELPIGPLYGRHWSLTGRGIPSARSADAAVELPGRNLLLVTAAALAAARHRRRTIMLGILKGNPFGDATPSFFARLEACLSEWLGGPVRIATPLARLTKPALMHSARRAPLHLTFSCINPRGVRHCGRCNKCAERRRAFRAARLPDPTHYAT